MKIIVENGANFISIGFSGIGTYLKIKKPVSLIWYDCGGSVAEYLCMMPVSETTRKQLHASIHNIIYEDFTGRVEELYPTLQPLFTLFENGEYYLSYNNGGKRRITTTGSGNIARTYEKGWFAEYPEMVDLNRADELKNNYKEDRCVRNLKSSLNDLVDFTSTWIYDTWENDMYIATRPLSEINGERITFYEEKIKGGERPFAILMNAFYEPSDDYSGYFILDGHHKLQAYKNLDIDPPYVIITRNFHTTNEPEFDLESLAVQLYPWQIKHILNNWNKEDGEIAELLKNPNSALHHFIKNGFVKEYHDNKEIKSEAFYLNDKVEGKLLEWYDNGQLKRERYYNNGKSSGIWHEWFPSGQLTSTHGYDDNGQIDGKSISYFENGKLRSEYLFKNGKHADGYGFTRWGHTQNMEYEFWYENGIIIKKKTYSDDGRLIYSEYYDKEQCKLVKEPINNSFYYQGPKASPGATPEKNLNIIPERQYPQSGNNINWRWIAILLLLLLQLVRMCH